jgi:large subunit ribosomal protein L15
VNLETLEKANLIDRSVLRARIMLSGEIKKAVTVEGITVTKGARAAIEKAGGKIVEAAQEAAK